MIMCIETALIYIFKVFIIKFDFKVMSTDTVIVNLLFFLNALKKEKRHNVQNFKKKTEMFITWERKFGCSTLNTYLQQRIERRGQEHPKLSQLTCSYYHIQPLLYKQVNCVSKDQTKRTQTLSEVIKWTHSKMASRIFSILALLLFFLPKTKLRKVWIWINNSVFICIFWGPNIQESLKFAGPTAGNIFSAMHF